MTRSLLDLRETLREFDALLGGFGIYHGYNRYDGAGLTLAPI